MGGIKSVSRYAWPARFNPEPTLSARRPVGGRLKGDFNHELPKMQQTPGGPRTEGKSPEPPALGVPLPVSGKDEVGYFRYTEGLLISHLYNGHGLTLDRPIPCAGWRCVKLKSGEQK